MNTTTKILVCAVLLFTAACTSGTENNIGVIAPLSGGAVELGQHITRGLELANEDLGGKYNLIYEDGRCDALAGLTAARKLVSVDNVQYVIGPLCTPPYTASAPFFNQHKVAFMHTSGIGETSESVAGKYGIDAMSTATIEENRALAKHIKENLGITKMAVFTWNQEWALNHRNGFVSEFEKLGGEIVFDELFNAEDKEFRTGVLKLKESGAEGVFIASINFLNAEVVKQIRTIDDEIVIFGQYEIEDVAFIRPAGSAAEGIEYAYPKIDHNDARTRDMVLRYKAKYGSDPNYYVYIGYDSLMLYDHALETCDDPACAVEKILSVENYKGVSGIINFNGKKVSREFEIRRIVDGKAQPIA